MKISSLHYVALSVKYQKREFSQILSALDFTRLPLRKRNEKKLLVGKSVSVKLSAISVIPPASLAGIFIL